VCLMARSFQQLRKHRRDNLISIVSCRETDNIS
jgi:hypothetical protein